MIRTVEVLFAVLVAGFVATLLLGLAIGALCGLVIDESDFAPIATAYQATVEATRTPTPTASPIPGP